MKCFSKTITESGSIINVPCWFVNFKLGSDNANDPQVTVYDSNGAPAGTPTELVPTNPYDASAMGLNGISGDQSYARYGIYVVIEAVGGGAFGGAAEVTIGVWPTNIADSLNPFA